MTLDLGMAIVIAGSCLGVGLYRIGSGIEMASFHYRKAIESCGSGRKEDANQ